VDFHHLLLAGFSGAPTIRMRMRRRGGDEGRA
jgi:hypothetical protein